MKIAFPSMQKIISVIFYVLIVLPIVLFVLFSFLILTLTSRLQIMIDISAISTPNSIYIIFYERSFLNGKIRGNWLTA